MPNNTEQTSSRFQVSHQLADKMEEIASWYNPDEIYNDLWNLYMHAFNDDPTEDRLSLQSVNQYAFTVMLTTSLLISVIDQVAAWREQSPDQAETL